MCGPLPRKQLLYNMDEIDPDAKRIDDFVWNSNVQSEDEKIAFDAK
jgi:hypothetical protein